MTYHIFVQAVADWGSLVCVIEYRLCLFGSIATFKQAFIVRCKSLKRPVLYSPIHWSRLKTALGDSITVP